MRKISRNFSLPPIKLNINSVQANNKTMSNTKITKTTNSKISKVKINKIELNKILIYIRFRPLPDKEKQLSLKDNISLSDNRTIILKEFNDDNNSLKKSYKYSFDKVFDKTVDNNTLYEKGIKFLIDELIENKKNIFVFNYSTKDSGKSFNKIGKNLLEEIYAKIKLVKDKTYVLKCSFFEIFDNNNIIDLLKEKKENLNEKDTITEIKVNSDKDILNFLNEKKDIKGNKNNSCIILKISLGYYIDSNIIYNQFNLIDLDNLSPFFDIENIQLGLNNNSKFSSLLNNLDENNSKIIMISHISTLKCNFEETFNTLNCMKKIKNIFGEIKKIKNEIKLNDTIREKILNQNNKNKKNFNNNKSNFNNTISDSFNYSQRTSYFQKSMTSLNIPLNEDNNNTNNDKEFQEKILELKKACDNQVYIKQKIISIQREIDRTNEEKNLIKELDIKMNEYKDYSSKIEKIYNEINTKENITEMQKYLLNLIMRNSSHKIQMLDNKYQNLLNMAKINFQEEYINELEKQIKYRDDIFMKNGINLNRNVYPKYKVLKHLKNEFLARNVNPEFKSIINSSFNRKEKSENPKHVSISLRNIKIKNYFLNNEKIKEYRCKKIPKNKSVYDKEKSNIFILFRQNSEGLKKKLKEINNLSTLKYDNTKGNKKLDLIYNEKLNDMDCVDNGKKILDNNQNELKKALTKRNLHSKILLDNLNLK